MKLGSIYSTKKGPSPQERNSACGVLLVDALKRLSPSSSPRGALPLFI
jgi:hypothetical protein